MAERIILNGVLSPSKFDAVMCVELDGGVMSDLSERTFTMQPSRTNSLACNGAFIVA